MKIAFVRRLKSSPGSIIFCRPWVSPRPPSSPSSPCRPFVALASSSSPGGTLVCGRPAQSLNWRSGRRSASSETSTWPNCAPGKRPWAAPRPARPGTLRTMHHHQSPLNQLRRNLRTVRLLRVWADDSGRDGEIFVLGQLGCVDWERNLVGTRVTRRGFDASVDETGGKSCKSGFPLQDTRRHNTFTGSGTNIHFILGDPPCWDSTAAARISFRNSAQHVQGVSKEDAGCPVAEHAILSTWPCPLKTEDERYSRGLLDRSAIYSVRRPGLAWTGMILAQPKSQKIRGPSHTGSEHCGRRPSDWPYSSDS